MTHTVKKQFVIQQHTAPDGVHWDLMLEMDDCLWTWRLNTPPAEIKNEPVPAERIHDHPKRFLTYEGPVQNGTGQVTIADHGELKHIIVLENFLKFFCSGIFLSGIYILRDHEHKKWNMQILCS